MGQRLPEGFVYVTDVVSVVEDIKYYTEDNFLGMRVDGYHSPRAVSTLKAACALKGAVEMLHKKGYGLKIFDAYRPKRAVDHFLRWASDSEDTKNKATYYPDIDKGELIQSGYISNRSNHSRGSVFDLTLIDLNTHQEIDMGTVFDYFGEASHHGSTLISDTETTHRNILKHVMITHGFLPIKEEWWHYELKDEPYTDTYFDFEIQSDE